jgi:hypothetical protein
MKNLLIDFSKVAVLGTALTLSLGACQNEVLDLNPKDSFAETTAFATPERIELAVAGVYDAAQSGFYAGNAVRGYPFGAAHVQQGDMRGEDMTLAQRAAFFGITYQSTIDNTTPNNGFMWQTLYRLINRANIVIAGLKTATPTSTFTQAQIDAYEGECRFLRALAHHELLKNWSRPYSDNPNGAASGVPYRTQAIGVSLPGAVTTTEALQQGRNTLVECYQKLIEDLDFAERTLPATRANAIIRATRGAAIALKTRIYLHQNNFTKVVEEANKLVPTAAPFTSPVGNYRLTATPLGAFGAGNKSNTESIFSIDHNAGDNAGVNGSLSTMNCGLPGARGLVCISPVLWNQSFWLASDLRKTGAVSGFGGFRYVNKYIDFTNLTDNAPIIRYAEVILNAAEAEARLGNATRALSLLNTIRNRAVTDVANQFGGGITAPIGDDLIRAILNERRIELLSEGFRWGDIHRLLQDAKFGTGGIPAKVDAAAPLVPMYTGNAQNTVTGINPIAYGDRRILWPIPIEETANNPTLASQQNPGW